MFDQLALGRPCLHRRCDALRAAALAQATLFVYFLGHGHREDEDFYLIDFGPGIRILAQTVEPVTVRCLNAIHLATALHYRSGLTSFVTYDKRLLDAAPGGGPPGRLACMIATSSTNRSRAAARYYSPGL